MARNRTRKTFGKIKESYSNCVDMALSEGETLPYYDIEVADMNFLSNRLKGADRDEERREFTRFT
ncbi:hypothetical protein PO124_28060 [Bacillus licheniformis]|nr:hypothetical protein [Bacillus licheniformis]